MADEPLVLELTDERGDSARVEWDLSQLAAVGEGDPAQFNVVWLAERWELGRVFSGALGDGRLLAIAALRPAGARGHGEEAVAAALVRDGEAVMIDDALLSVEYGPDGTARRLGLELYEQPESLPLRVAGDLSGQPGPEQSQFELRVDGVDGVGVLAVIKPS